jgi:geranylgeranyl diphosphate synthase, type II
MTRASPATHALADEVAARLAEYRDLVRPALLEVLPAREPKRHLYDLIRVFLEQPGKGLRPALCIATCTAFGGRKDDALPTAAALELLHNALLVHDDVEDESEYRRSIPTLHTTSGVPIAINAGDAMNALTLGLLMKNRALVGPNATWRIFEEFQHLLLESLEGQAIELGWIQDNDCTVGEDDYLRMILKKTCWYSFIHPCRLGALIAGQDSLDRFNRFGFLTGAAFQIQDDVLNLTGDESRYGKEIGGDLWEGKRTLILAHAMSRAEPRDRARVEQTLAKPRKRRLQRDIDWIHALLTETGSLDHAARAARELAESALQEFEIAYAGAAESPDKSFLRKLVTYVIDRDA